MAEAPFDENDVLFGYAMCGEENESENDSNKENSDKSDGEDNLHGLEYIPHDKFTGIYVV